MGSVYCSGFFLIFREGMFRKDSVHEAGKDPFFSLPGVNGLFFYAQFAPFS
jgi:hypothetical protein